MNVILIAPSALLLVCFYLVRKFYLPPALSVKRFEASARSEVLSHVSSTVNGLPTIRYVKRSHIYIFPECFLRSLLCSARNVETLICNFLNTLIIKILR